MALAHALPAAPQTYTYADYQLFPAGERWELLDGQAVCMSPAPTPNHQRIVGDMYRQLANQLRGKPCEPFIAPLDVLLPRTIDGRAEADDQVTTVVQPDVAVFCNPAQVEAKFARGAPDFVIEVLSAGTAGRDQIQKRRKYEQAGVRELWLVDPEERVLFIHRRGEAGLMAQPAEELAGQTAVTCLPGVAISWDEVVERMPERPPQDP